MLVTICIVMEINECRASVRAKLALGGVWALSQINHFWPDDVMKYICSFNALGNVDEALVSGKFASLREMVSRLGERAYVYRTGMRSPLRPISIFFPS